MNTDSETELTPSKILELIENSSHQRRNKIQQCPLSSKPSTSKVTPQEESFLIEAALHRNKKLNEKMKELQLVVIENLHECQMKLNELCEVKKQLEKPKKLELFRYSNCGIPYFKDKYNSPPPDNEDIVIMGVSSRYNFSDFYRYSRWTDRDKENFFSLILKMSRDKRREKLHSQIFELHLTMKDSTQGEKDKLQKQVSNLENEIKSIYDKPLKDIVLPINEDYNWHYVSNKLKRHSPEEYESLWKLYLHPSINQSSWKKNEHVLFQQIAKHHNFQDWDAIAKELNTGRTGYQCFIHFRTTMKDYGKNKKWTQQEEQKLINLVDYYKVNEYIPWNVVASNMKNRTKRQVYGKYFRLMEKKKGRFLTEEDIVLLKCVDDFGSDFKKMKSFLPERSMSQIRNRYNILKQKISAVWSTEEDRILVMLMANQDSTTDYSGLIKFFPGKNRMQIRARYRTLQAWMKKHPCVDISKAPRRGARRLNHGHASNLTLKAAVKKLKTRTVSVVQPKKCSKITVNSEESAIEEAIMVTIFNQDNNKQKTVEKKLNLDSSSNSQVDFVTNLNDLLVILKAKFTEEKFISSPYLEKYPSLLEEKVIKIKTYSKSDSQISKPNIWGNAVSNSVTYLVPPHYATIIGCNKIMSYCSKHYSSSSYVDELIKKNSVFKQQYQIILERFHSLFLWPLILSNENPLQIKTGENLLNILINKKERFSNISSTEGASTSKNGEISDEQNEMIDYSSDDDSDSQ